MVGILSFRVLLKSGRKLGMISITSSKKLKILGSVALGCYQKISVGPLELLLLQVLGLAESRNVDNVSKWLQSRCMESRFHERTHFMNFSCSL